MRALLQAACPTAGKIAVNPIVPNLLRAEELPTLRTPLSSLTDPSGDAAVFSAEPSAYDPLYQIRTFRESDAPRVRELYTQGLLGGHLAGNDTGLDIDDIEQAYLSDPMSHFWVAETTEAAVGAKDILGQDAYPGCVVGMIGVQHHDEGVGEIRRLRVCTRHRRRRIGSRLLETAIRFCRDVGCLKVQLDTYIEREAAMNLFDRFRFRHGRTRQLQGRDMLYFYIDLYSKDEKE